ncbi:MAG: indole-3-glycerol-phosphate synthase [Vicinamibacteria bacterium]
MGLLGELVASARERAKEIPPREGAPAPGGATFRDALRGKNRLAVIAEFKRRSPSLGAIAEPNLEAQVKGYERAGAAAISVLTEPTRFQGSSQDLVLAARSVEVPVLMKDFVVEPAQVQEAAFLGARAVLLIVRCLSRTELEELVSACAHYGVTPLIECHDASEIERALAFGDAVIGANNRDLESLEIDRTLAPRLLVQAPRDRVVVAESGYESAEDVSSLRGLADAVLVGSALMRRSDPETLIREIRE